MDDQINNRPKGRRRRRVNKRRLMTVIVLFLLCVASLVYILTHFGNQGAQKAEEPAEEVPAAEESTVAPEEADAAAAEKAALHVYSHRGSAGSDELTFITYDRAIEEGSKIIEADMVVSMEDTIYLARDDNAYEMTGVNGFFSGMADSQIDALKTKSGNNILRLKDVFDRYGDSVTYIVDVKYVGARNIEAFTKLVKKYGFEDNVIAASSYFDALRPLDEEFPDMPKLYICADESTLEVALAYDFVDIISVPKSMMTADNLKAVHKENKKFSAWTLNSEEEILKAIDLGVDTYFTDDSGLAVKLEKEHRTEDQ